MEPDDMALLRDYAASQSEPAFAQLVARHLNFVYSSALRRTGDAQLAEEVAQGVFIVLARKAETLGAGTVLTGWLYRATQFVAITARRQARRRQQREQEAFMQSLLDSGGDASSQQEIWQQLAPLLEAALDQLNARDRDAVLLRFFENRKLAEVGAALGVSEDGARLRINRALEKLRQLFARHGVNSTADAISGAITANSIQTAPAALAATVTAATKGTAASTSTLTLVKGALKIMAWTRAKTAIAIGVGVLFAVGIIATGSLWDWFTHKEIAFEAQGALTYAATWPDATYTKIEHFTVARHGNVWKIRTSIEKQEYTGPPEDTNDVDLYWEMGFDGKNLYTLEQQNREKLLPTVPPPVLKRGVIFAEGSVQTANSPPHNDAEQFYPVWLAYCSAPYFQKLKGDKVVAPRFASGDFLDQPVKRMELAAKWDIHNRYFLKDATWFSDGTTETVGPNGKSFIEKYHPPYDKPFVEGRFEILSWTNWGGVSMPSDFKLTVYRPDYASTNVAKFVVAYTATGSLDQIQNIREFTPVPKLNMATRITDFRIKVRRGLRSTSYISTNRWNISNSIHR